MPPQVGALTARVAVYKAGVTAVWELVSFIPDEEFQAILVYIANPSLAWAS